jgi:uncharacterized membrane protein
MEVGLPHIRIERDMGSVDPDLAYKIASDISNFPNFMTAVLSVQEVPDPERRISAWRVLFNGNELEWTEVDRYDPVQRCIEFEQIDGDLAEWRGRLKIEVTGGRVFAFYEIYFDLGIPALAGTLHPLGEQVLRANCSLMLEEMERRAKLQALQEQEA